MAAELDSAEERGPPPAALDPRIGAAMFRTPRPNQSGDRPGYMPSQLPRANYGHHIRAASQARSGAFGRGGRRKKSLTHLEKMGAFGAERRVDSMWRCRPARWPTPTKRSIALAPPSPSPPPPRPPAHPPSALLLCLFTPHHGHPARANLDRCVNGRRGRSATATWSSRMGQSSTRMDRGECRDGAGGMRARLSPARAPPRALRHTKECTSV